MFLRKKLPSSIAEGVIETSKSFKNVSISLSGI